MTVLHDRLWHYRTRIDADEVDVDLTASEREDVSRLLDVAIQILHQFGGTPAVNLVRMCHDESVTSRVNERVAKIITEA